MENSKHIVLKVLDTTDIDRELAVDPVYVNVPPSSKEHKQLKGCNKPTINIKMIGLNYKFESGPTAREVLTAVTIEVCEPCLVDSVCNVVCSKYFDTYREMVQWLNDNNERPVCLAEVQDKVEEFASALG